MKADSDEGDAAGAGALPLRAVESFGSAVIVCVAMSVDVIDSVNGDKLEKRWRC